MAWHPPGKRSTRWLMGDVAAIRQGPKAIAQRIVRKAAYRGTARITRKRLGF